MPNLNFNAKSLMQSQRGNDCKMIAIGAVLNWLHENKKITYPPLPARFRHKKAKQPKPKDGRFYSLRQVAKQKLAEKYGGEAKDQVTESIDDPEILAQVARHHSDVVADFIDCESEAHYLYVIEAAINQDLAPIVFFDVNPKTHKPGIFAGTHEHSAIVIGHEQGGMSENGWANRAFFILAQWGNKTEVESRALFCSSQQLRSEQATESYYRYPERKEEQNKGSGWIPVSQITNPKLEFLRSPDRFKEARAVRPGEAQPDLSPQGHLGSKGYLKRQAPASVNNHGGLRRKVLLIGSKQHHEHIIARLKALKPGAVPPQSIFLLQRWKDFLRLIGLCSLYAMAHSTAALILNTTVLGLATFTASWVLFIAIVALAIVLIAAAHCKTDEAGLPKIRPEFHPMTSISSKPPASCPPSPVLPGTKLEEPTLLRIKLN